MHLSPHMNLPPQIFHKMRGHKQSPLQANFKDGYIKAERCQVTAKDLDTHISFHLKIA